ncbi:MULTISPECIES: MFS transporter [Roseivirga]|uniref:MFS transporter n=1 Tax=Roseivirga spongicola TaxID=333140 RepID=A0A150X5X9_9BACT|nr:MULTISPECIES: MFS transporter [Roseivirga]KYG74145.1 MFS transporter [Roseivirga spongicola]MBO6495346.1 MFS transporter [Roseivirga sp.]MBO6660465.1 MFS transporter [Roseivirga sp.]MBO6762183.1 MFS transporter [Roseivirga sp.]MBO6906798.1 MFS transporter [Roseivirga sp.]
MLNFQKNLTKPFFMVLSLPATAMGFALSVQIAALSWILNTKFGFNLEEIGYVWLAGPAAGILGQVIIGLVSDNVWFWGGRRRPFILIGGIIASIMLLALPNIGVISEALGLEEVIGVAIAVALSLDLAINISFNPTRSVIADVTPKGAVRTKGYTWMQTISGFFGVVAYLIGAFISNYTLIYLGAILVFLFSVIPTLFITEPKNLTPEDEIIDTDQSKQKTNLPEFLKVCVAHAFTWIGVQTMFIYTFSFIKENIMGFGTTEQLTEAQNDEVGFITGVSFAILNTVGFLLPALVLEPITKKIGRVKTHMLCIATMAIGYLLIILFGNSSATLFILMAVVGIGWAAVVSLPFAIMSETVDQSRMGWYMGLFNLSVVLPQLVASGLGGFIDTAEDKSMIFIISAISLGISAVLWLLVKENKNNIQHS